MAQYKIGQKNRGQECKREGLIPLSPTAWGCCLCGYNSDEG